MSLAPGTRIGPYEVVSMIGAGGMGEVYRARDTRLGRTVAIKFIRSDLDEATEARAQFEREGRAIAALNHPRICSVYHVGSFVSQNYLVMECLDGETLEHRLRRGPLPLDELFTVAIAVAEGLVAAHRAGIVHRDLKPANVMLTRDGPKLLDFGIAKQTLTAAVANEQETGKTVTAPSTITGRIVGTIPYMAPEQLEGARTDGRTDVFAFGAMLFEMATGERAFGGVSAASQIAAILADARPHALQRRPDIPRAFDRIISTCLAKDPDDRWQHAADLLRELQWAAEDARDGPTTGAHRSRSRTVHVYWAAALLLVCVPLGLLWWAARDPAPPRNPQPVIVLLDSPLTGRVYRSPNRRGGRHECGRCDGCATRPACGDQEGKHQRRLASRGAGAPRKPGPDCQPSIVFCGRACRGWGSRHHRTLVRRRRVPLVALLCLFSGEEPSDALHRVLENRNLRAKVGRPSGWPIRRRTYRFYGVDCIR